MRKEEPDGWALHGTGIYAKICHPPIPTPPIGKYGGPMDCLGLVVSWVDVLLSETVFHGPPSIKTKVGDSHRTHSTKPGTP